MRKLLGCAALILGSGAIGLLSQTQLGLRSLRGPAIWMRDSGSGSDILIDLDPKTLVLLPPGTAGGRPILQAKPPDNGNGTFTLREKSIQVTYSGTGPIPLPDIPLPNTAVKLFWGGTLQSPGTYSWTGNSLTLPTPPWQAGDNLVITYFY